MYHTVRPKHALSSKEKVVNVLFPSIYSFDANETMDSYNRANTSIFTDDEEGNDDDNSSTEDARYTDNVALGYYNYITCSHYYFMYLLHLVAYFIIFLFLL